VGRPEVELAFDLQGKMTLALAICHELKSMRPLFVEEPAGEFYHPTDGSVADW
jgi:L-alanine-DL-glutamate epimerase-like enolase superfamily enzyme